MSELLSVRDVAHILKVSEDTVVRRFHRRRGVIDMGRAGSTRKRGYRILRIPKHVVEAYLAELSGAPVSVEVPDRAERRRRTPNWEHKAIRNLAKAAIQNGLKGCRDRKLFERIASHARMLTFIDEREWNDVWFDEDETEQEW